MTHAHIFYLIKVKYVVSSHSAFIFHNFYYFIFYYYYNNIRYDICLLLQITILFDDTHYKTKLFLYIA